MPTSVKNAVRVSSLHLRRTFENLKAPGRSIVDLLIYDLERQGIALGQDESHTLERIR
ncbi:hypothetical protein [Nitrososphaera sp.]|uniref:hypothetical protein n=1 Tax=Nitrososphaera sp. TaxID=1971748 RepID=UPI002ED94590